MTQPILLRQRRLDLVLVAIFGCFALTSFLFDFAAGLDAGPDTLLGKGVHTYAQLADPLVGQNPLWLRVASFISGAVFGPFYIVLVYGLIHDRRWIRVPSLIYIGAILYSMVLYYSVELAGPLPPTNYAIFFGSTLPYVLAPLLLAWRLWRSRELGVDGT